MLTKKKTQRNNNAAEWFDPSLLIINQPLPNIRALQLESQGSYRRFSYYVPFLSSIITRRRRPRPPPAAERGGCRRSRRGRARTGSPEASPRRRGRRESRRRGGGRRRRGEPGNGKTGTMLANRHDVALLLGDDQIMVLMCVPWRILILWLSA